LLGLIYVVASELADRTVEQADRKRNFKLEPTARNITAEATKLSPLIVTRQLTTAKNRGLFTRANPESSGRIPNRKTAARGYMTEAGWAALRESSWREKYGSDWRRTAKWHELRVAVEELAAAWHRDE
jgi:hypothetical protein